MTLLQLKQFCWWICAYCAEVPTPRALDVTIADVTPCEDPWGAGIGAGCFGGIHDGVARWLGDFPTLGPNGTFRLWQMRCNPCWWMFRQKCGGSITHDTYGQFTITDFIILANATAGNVSMNAWYKTAETYTPPYEDPTHLILIAFNGGWTFTPPANCSDFAMNNNPAIMCCFGWEPGLACGFMGNEITQGHATAAPFYGCPP